MNKVLELMCFGHSVSKQLTKVSFTFCELFFNLWILSLRSEYFSLFVDVDRPILSNECEHGCNVKAKFKVSIMFPAKLFLGNRCEIQEVAHKLLY